MYRGWGFGVIMGVLALLAGYGISQGASKQCLFAWEPSATTAVDAYRLYGAAMQGGQQVGQNFVHIPKTALPDPLHPSYTVLCAELSFWKVTAYASTFTNKESVFSNELQVPAFIVAPPSQLAITSIEESQEGTATIQQIITLHPK